MSHALTATLHAERTRRAKDGTTWTIARDPDSYMWFTFVGFVEPGKTVHVDAQIMGFERGSNYVILIGKQYGSPSVITGID